MMCQDCIHYKSIGTLCDKYIYPEERNNEPCEYYAINDGSYNVYPTHESVGDALDSWESVSK